MTFELRGPDLRQTITNTTGLDQALDRLEQGLDQPSLVALTSSSGTLQIGMGNPSSSVVLFLDADHQPWVVQQRTTPETARGATFVNDAVAYDFYPSAVVTPEVARRAAHEFLETGDRPTSLSWAREHS